MIVGLSMVMARAVASTEDHHRGLGFVVWPIVARLLGLCHCCRVLDNNPLGFAKPVLPTRNCLQYWTTTAPRPRLPIHHAKLRPTCRTRVVPGLVIRAPGYWPLMYATRDHFAILESQKTGIVPFRQRSWLWYTKITTPCEWLVNTK